MSKIIVTFMSLMVMITFVAIVYVSLNNTEKYECLKWQKQAKKFPSFFVTTWQEEQCKYHNIKIR